MFEIKFESKAVMGVLGQMEHGLQDMTRLAGSISTEFLSQTEVNLEAEGRPQWLGLAASTIARREKRGTWPGKIMQESGQLAASFTPDHDSDSAWIGSNKKYAAIQHVGGQAGRGRKVRIESRPAMPVDAQGNLQPEAEDAIFGIANAYLASL